jgi:voltage-gated potassium channel
MGALSRWTASGLGARITVGLALAVAALSLATGIANIGAQTLNVPHYFGPLAATIPPEVQRTAGFTGALTGFTMLLAALGLRRGLRAAWWLTVVLLPVTALQGVVQSSPLSIPLVALSALALPNLLIHRRRFDRPVDLSTTQLAAATAIVGAQVYGTVGTYALREEFGNVETLVDAAYFTLVTASTVGYGDVTPGATSGVARLFSMSVIVVGVASFGLAVGSILGPALEARFTHALGRMTETQLDLLEGHILVLGHGDLTEPILEELGDTPFVVITTDQARVAELSERGVDVLLADPSDEEPLRRANVDEARAVVAATNNDAEDALAVLTARQLNPDIPIVAAATNRENVAKLRRAGADTVVSPASIGGRLIVRSALGEEGVESVADRVAAEAGDGGPDAPDDPDA